MKQTLLYARVSSKDQEREGYSIPAQLKLLREYARAHDLQIVREFVDVETAKASGRKQFGEMLRFFRQNHGCRTLIVEKTDRLYRNFRDCVALEDLEVEIHLPKEGQIISKEAKSQAKLVHGIQVVIARNYIENLREEVCKGMREKAEQGIYPSRPLLGYRNNKLERTIEVEPDKAPIAQRIFELYGTGKHSLSNLRRVVASETGRLFAKGYRDKILKNPFYSGFFLWKGKTYKGTHTPLVSSELYERVQGVFRSHNRPKQRKHQFAFSGLLRCSYDNCAVTAEVKKGRYIYYHCTGYRGKCALPYFREEKLGVRLGQVLKDIYVPDDVLGWLQGALLRGQDHVRKEKQQQQQRLQRRLADVQRRIDQACLNKLDGKISEEFWLRKTNEWNLEEQQVLLAIQGLEEVKPDRMLDGVRILELANKAYFLYLRQNPTEQGKLLRIVLSNCLVDAASLYPTYRKPFDLILGAAKTGEWRAWGDSNARPLVPETSALSN